MSKTVYKYDKRIRRWYREVDGKRLENLKLGVGYNTTNGRYLFNSDGTRTKLNANNSKIKKNNDYGYGYYDFTNINPYSTVSSSASLLDRMNNWLNKRPRTPFKLSEEEQNEYARMKERVRRYNLYQELKKKEAQRIKDSSQVQEWSDLKRYKKQLSDETNTWSDLLNEQYSRKRDARSINRGYKIKLVDGVNQMGKPAKYYYFYNPLTGELGNKVSKYYLKDNGYSMKGVTPVVFENLHNAQMVSLHKNTTHRDITKRATNNIDHSSYDLANTAMGGALNVTPTNVIGGIAGGVRKGQSFLGAASNTLFGQDFVDPRKSGNYGLLEVSNPTANWAARHPTATAAINAAGDMALGYGLNRVLKMPGTRTGIKTARYTREGLGTAGRFSNSLKEAAVNTTKNIGSRAVTKIKKLPGGSTVSSTGRKVLNTGKDTWRGVRNYGTRTVQRIPLGTRLLASNAWGKTKNFFGYFKPINWLDKGLNRITGYGLTSDARSGYKFFRNTFNTGLAGYALYKGEEDFSPTKFSKVVSYIPGLTYLEKPFDYYSKFNDGVKTYNNIDTINNQGIHTTLGNLWQTGEDMANVII